MDTPKLLRRVIQIYNDTVTAGLRANENEVLIQLSKLRELLNDQPELEAGGATETPAETSDS